MLQYTEPFLSFADGAQVGCCTTSTKARPAGAEFGIRGKAQSKECYRDSIGSTP
jgi:hypothetical protein